MYEWRYAGDVYRRVSYSMLYIIPITPSSFNLSCRSIVLDIDLDDLGFMNKGPSDEVIHTQREGSVGQWGRQPS